MDVILSQQFIWHKRSLVCSCEHGNEILGSQKAGNFMIRWEIVIFKNDKCPWRWSDSRNLRTYATCLHLSIFWWRKVLPRASRSDHESSLITDARLILTQSWLQVPHLPNSWSPLKWVNMSSSAHAYCKVNQRALKPNFLL